MRVEHLKRLPAVLLVIALVIGFNASIFRSAQAAACGGTCNYPYLKTFGSDVMTGGWYNDGTSCATDSSSNYQDQNYPDGGVGLSGGVLTYAKQSSGNSAGGSSSQYGVFAIGGVDGDTGTKGFYSSGALAPTLINKLTFANNTSWGGLYEGSIRQSNCIPDYYSTKRPSAAPPMASPLSGPIAPAAGGTFGSLSFATCTPSVYCLTSSNVTINASTHLTIFVSGNVYIDHNIVYGAHDANSVPKFALVVRGSIYIAPSVNQLDGLYIAQPNPADASPVNSDDGIIWTCHPNVTGTLDYTYPPQCTSPLVVNGAFIAKQVNLLRVKGDIGGANTGEDALATVNNCISGGCNVAEVINYTPDMIMGGGFFENSSGGGGSTGLPIDSVISLPPVF